MMTTTKTTTKYPYYYQLVCPQCDYTFSTMHEWLIKLKCGAHRSTFKHTCGSVKRDGRYFPPPQTMLDRKEPYEPYTTTSTTTITTNNNNNNDTLHVKDRHFFLSWSLADEKKIERYTDALRLMYGKPEFADLYTKLADVMIDLVDRKHNDHHSATADLGHDWLKVEPLNQPAFEDDMLTFQGINKLLKIYFGSASGVFKWVAKSSASATPTPYDTTLTTETGTRQDSSTTGFHEIKGCSIRILSTYAATLATQDIYQIGIFDASTSGMMLAKHDFVFPALHHVLNADAFSLGCVIDFIPFGDA